MAEQRLADAAQALRVALAGQGGTDFKDLASSAVAKLTRAASACRARPEALDGVVQRKDMGAALRVVLKASERPAFKSQVKTCLVHLLARAAWARAAQIDPELKGELLAFLTDFAGTAEIRGSLEVAAGLDGDRLVPLSGRPEVAESGALAPEEEEVTRRHLHNGLLALQKVGFVYPAGASSSAIVDDAIIGFGQVVQGLSRITCKFDLVRAGQMGTSLPSESVGPKAIARAKALADSTEAYKKMVQEYEAYWPRMVEFLVTLHKARLVERKRVEYVGQKLLQFSQSFRLACAERSDLPWAWPALPAGEPEGVGAIASEDNIESMSNVGVRRIFGCLGVTVADIVINQEDILKEGWLQKRSKRLKRWRRRWFVLTPQYLCSFKRQNELRNPTEAIRIRDCSMGKYADEESGSGQCFRVDTPTRVFYLSADSSSEKEAWIGQVELQRVRPALLAADEQRYD